MNRFEGFFGDGATSNAAKKMAEMEHELECMAPTEAARVNPEALGFVALDTYKRLRDIRNCLGCIVGKIFGTDLNIGNPDEPRTVEQFIGMANDEAKLLQEELARLNELI